MSTARDYLRTSLTAFITEKELLPSATPTLQAVDLNNDLAKEWIASDSTCTARKQLCRHIILAGNNQNFVVLGEFDALKISPSSQYTHGVRDILVYNDRINEFKYNTVKWNSAMSSYTPIKEVALP